MSKSSRSSAEFLQSITLIFSSQHRPNTTKKLRLNLNTILGDVWSLQNWPVPDQIRRNSSNRQDHAQSYSLPAMGVT